MALTIAEPSSSTAAHFKMDGDPEPVLLARIRGIPQYLEFMRDAGRTIASIEYVCPSEYESS